MCNTEKSSSDLFYLSASTGQCLKAWRTRSVYEPGYSVLYPRLPWNKRFTAPAPSPQKKELMTTMASPDKGIYVLFRAVYVNRKFYHHAASMKSHLFMTNAREKNSYSLSGSVFLDKSCRRAIARGRINNWKVVIWKVIFGSFMMIKQVIHL